MKSYFNKKKFLKYSFSIITSFIILYFLVKTMGNIDIKNLKFFLGTKIILFSSLIYLLIKIINTVRYNLIFKTKGFFKTINILFYCNFILSLIPFRIGEVSYVSLFKKYYEIECEKSVGNIIILRLFDYLSVCFFSIVSFLLIIKNGNVMISNKLFTYPLYLSIITSILLIIFVLFVKKGGSFLKKYKKYVDFTDVSKKELVFVASTSILYWFLRFSLGIYLFYAVGIKMGYVEIFFISTLMMIISLVPIQTFAGFGIFEGGWVGALILFGISKSGLLDKVVAVHIFSLLNVLFFGILSWTILHILIQNKVHHTY